MGRTIKIGRKIINPVAQHWAIKVDKTWYEVAGKSDSSAAKVNKILRSNGNYAASTAGSFGGEIAGDTDKTDSQIDNFITEWEASNPDYDFTTDNCQKFVYEMLVFLTNGTNFRLPHRFDSALTAKEDWFYNKNMFETFTKDEDGIAIARVGSWDSRAAAGPFQLRFAGPSAEASVVSEAGLGAWANASVARYEANLGPIGGVHLEPNVNTGMGVRDGNLDVHVLGFGTRIGADGVEINTPIGGINACVMM